MSKRAAFSILSFLQASIADGTVREDDAEGIEVAIQCIAEAFSVSLDSPTDVAAFALPAGQSLGSVLEAHVANSPAPAPKVAKVATAEEKAAAEKHKSVGNQLMAAKDYPGAIAAYGEAIKIDGANAVYLSNRAAAHSQLQAHSSAIADARAALVIDPQFSKAYSRLGHALFSSGEYQEAVDAYESGLALDPNNATMKSSLATARTRVAATREVDEDDDEEIGANAAATRAAGGAGGMPDFAAMMAGMGGAGGAGGMPGMPAGLASMMQNPAIMQMAQSMMANGGMESLMQNPLLTQMMSGGGMPDMGALMSDPSIRAMAEQMGALGGAGGARGGGGSDGPEDMYS